MSKEIVTFFAPDELVKKIDKEVGRDPESTRSSICRKALREYLQRKKKKKNA